MKSVGILLETRTLTVLVTANRYIYYNTLSNNMIEISYFGTVFQQLFAVRAADAGGPACNHGDLTLDIHRSCVYKPCFDYKYAFKRQ